MALKDLLLKFIYAEVLTMLAAFYTGQRILIRKHFSVNSMACLKDMSAPEREVL